MPDYSRQQRQSAAREFMQSLGQLESVLQPEAGSQAPPKAPRPVPPPPPVPMPPPLPEPPRPAALDDLEAAFEEAAADIEQFMNSHED